MDSTRGADKPHVVCVPVPAQSHVKAMLQFAKLLHHRGFYITFVNTDFNHKRLLNARGPHAVDGLPDFKFEAIPDGIPVSNPNATQDLHLLLDSVRNNKLLPPFLELLSNLKYASHSKVPRVSCIVSDAFMPFTITAAETVGVPVVYFFTIAACTLMGLKQFRALKDKGHYPLRDDSYLTNGYLDTIVDWIPGMRGIRLRDLPIFIQGTNIDDFCFNFSMESVENASKASAVVIHTFESIEHDVLQALSSILPPLYSIGPLPLLLERIPNDNPLKSMGCNFLKEESECLQWLDYKEKDSVLYVNFGSVSVLKQEQVEELAWGLANSKHHFLWVIRPDLVMGDVAILPAQFAAEAKDRCWISSWCPQEEVLNHPSVGGFLTHCGWNSTIESLCAGVPLICWPCYGDQQTNTRYSCIEWGIGLEIDSDVKRENIEKLVRELMEGVEGKKLKKKAAEWKIKAKEAAASNGSSSINFDKLIHEVLSKD